MFYSSVVPAILAAVSFLLNLLSEIFLLIFLIPQKINPKINVKKPIVRNTLNIDGIYDGGTSSTPNGNDSHTFLNFRFDIEYNQFKQFRRNHLLRVQFLDYFSPKLNFPYYLFLCNNTLYHFSIKFVFDNNLDVN